MASTNMDTLSLTSLIPYTFSNIPKSIEVEGSNLYSIVTRVHMCVIDLDHTIRVQFGSKNHLRAAKEEHRGQLRFGPLLSQSVVR